MATYDLILDYLNCDADIEAKILRYETIITALEDSLLNGALKSDLTQYSLDDGQTKITTVLRDPSAIARAISACEVQKERLINKCMGRVTVNRDRDAYNINKLY